MTDTNLGAAIAYLYKIKCTTSNPADLTCLRIKKTKDNRHPARHPGKKAVCYFWSIRGL